MEWFIKVYGLGYGFVDMSALTVGKPKHQAEVYRQAKVLIDTEDAQQIR